MQTECKTHIGLYGLCRQNVRHTVTCMVYADRMYVRHTEACMVYAYRM